MPWRGAAYDGEFPSLGWGVLEWAEKHFLVPDGPFTGDPLRLTDEQASIIVRFYGLDDHGKRLFRRAAVRRAKGWGKSPLLAVISLAELCGPVRFGGWDAVGEPVGVPQLAPWVQVAAVSEDQTDNTYSALYTMASESDLAGSTLDVGLTRVFLKGATGRLEPVTAAAGSREGQRVTFAVLDEALALDTPLPTPTGWTTMGDVKAGDRIIGSDGRPVEVLKATDPVDDRLCFRVRFADGTDLVASAGHLWPTKVRSSAALPKVRTTEEMFADRRVFRIPRQQALKTPEVPLPLDPYILGLWLGDGSKGQAYITAAEADAEFYLKEIRQLTEYARYVRVPNRTGRIALDFRQGPRNVGSTKQRLRQLGVLDHKGIPAAYLRSGIEQRVALLQGLMDTDGSVTAAGTCVFSQADAALTDQVLELIRSLGQVVSVNWRADDRARTGGGFKLNFTPAGLMPFRLPRKGDRVRGHRRGPDWITVTSIEPVPAVPVRCLGVDSADHLFVAGAGWKVTHNTHLWNQRNGGHKLAATIRRNAGKMNSATFESTNAHEPGEDSVAERTFRASEKGAAGLLYDSVEAPNLEDLSDRPAVLAGLRVAYGDASWVDLDRVVEEIADPATDENDARRFYFNQLVSSTGRFIDSRRWEELAAPATVAEGAYIGVGFDGSISDDATAMYGCTRAGFVFELGVWERPEGFRDGWRVPRLEVHELLRGVMRRFRVGLMLCDPPKWESEVDEWARVHGEKVVLAFHTWSARRFAPACNRFATGVAEGSLSHDGKPGLSLHLAACARKRVRLADDPDDGRSQFVIVKADTRKIDRAVGAVLAVEAAMSMPDEPLIVPSDLIDLNDFLDDGWDDEE